MRRREFIALLGGAAAWPITAPAQPTMPVIGFLSGMGRAETAHLVAAFRRGLQETRYIEGTSIAIDYRWAEGRYDRLPALAAELGRLPITLIVTTGGTPSALAAKAANSTIPIVFLSGGDPVKLGLVASLNQPAGRITGISQFTSALIGKRLELLRELVPTARSIAFLLNKGNP